MAGISLSKQPAGIWIVAGWAFRQILNDIIANYPYDPELGAECREAEALGFLHVDFLEGQIAERMREAVCSVNNGILTGRIRSRITDAFNDQETIKEYLVGLRSLAAVCDAARVDAKP